MDGLDNDADVAFVLTTNRPDMLERALAQRPGRVDLAVEIPLPAHAERVRLLELYARLVAFSPAALDAAAERTAGTTASSAPAGQRHGCGRLIVSRRGTPWRAPRPSGRHRSGA